MKNIQPLLFFFEIVNNWSYNSAIDIFELKKSNKFDKMFMQVYTGLSHPDCRYEMYYTAKNGSGAIGFVIEDRDTNEPVLFADLQSYGNKSTMYEDFMYIPIHGKNIYFSSRDSKVLDMEVQRDMEEDEHFQHMMIRDLPPYHSFKDAIAVYDYLQPIAEKHNIGFSIDYNHLNMDFSEFFPSQKAFNVIDSIFGNALELFYEAETHGNPFKYYTIS